jgi:hypothetical protein
MPRLPASRLTSAESGEKLPECREQIVALKEEKVCQPDRCTGKVFSI